MAGSFSGLGGSAGISITFFTSHAPFARCHSQTDADKVFQRNHHPNESVRLSRIVRGPHLENHLLIAA
jgi:hypothetical protein